MPKLHKQTQETRNKISIGLKKSYKEGKRTGFEIGHKGWWKDKKMSREHIINHSKALLGKYIGNKSIRWKGGKNLPTWKRAVKRRDNYTCQKCGVKDKRVLTADHIKSKKVFPELSFDIRNGITLCYNCHAIKTLEDKEYRDWMYKNHWKNKKINDY